MTYLNYDAGGFIVGVNRMNDGIDRVHDDTQEIIQILKSQNQIANTRMTELTRAVRKATYQANSQSSVNSNRERAASGRASSSSRITRQAPSASQRTRSNSNTQSIGNQTRAAGRNQGGNQAGNDTAPISRDSTNANTRTRSPNSDSPASTDAAGRERDARGRFTRGNGSASENERKRLGFGSLSGGRSDVSGIDPLVDSFREAKDLLSPLGRAGKLAGRGVKFSVSKLKAMKRREPLPNDQSRHNSENEKLLDKILKAIRKQNGSGGGGGLLGGLLGGGRGGRGGAGSLFKKMGGMRALGILSAVAGTAGLAMDWDSLDHQGKSEGVGRLAGAGAGAVMGATVGSVVPVVGTAIGAVVGGWLGSEVGEWLGGVASPHIESWTQSMIAYNLPDKMSDTWDGYIKPFFTKLDSVAGKINSWIEGKVDGFADFVTGGGDSVWTGETSTLKGTAAKAAYTASEYKAGNIGGLDDAMTRRLVASTVLTESAGGNPNAVNSGGYLGRYQAGAGWLAEAGLIKGGANSVKAAKAKDGYGGKSDWAWATSGGMTRFLKDSRNWTEGMSREKYLASPDIQDQAFQKATTKSYNQLKRMGAITANTSQKEVAGLLKAAHLGGAGNANKVAKGGTGATDAYGTSTRKYYNDIVQNKDGLDAALRKKNIIDNVVEAVTPEPAAPRKKTGNYTGGIMGSDAREKIKAVTNQNSSGSKVSSNFSDNAPMIFNSSTPASSDLGYAPAHFPSTPMLSVPNMPKVKQRLDSGGSHKPIMIQSNNDSIHQNVSDRSLAHAITGGLGQQRPWG